MSHKCFGKGNQLWKLADPLKVGKEPTYTTPEEVWEAACEYFKWCDDNPLIEGKPFNNNGSIVMAEIPKMIPYTVTGLVTAIRIGNVSWEKMGSGEEGGGSYTIEEYRGVREAIENVIRTQKFNGGMAGFFNANLTARDLGLSENTDHSSKDGTMTPKGFNDFYSDDEADT
jgi:hypothetical protein